MDYLLDTHALIWYLDGDDALSEKAKSCIDNKNATNFISIASLWEIAIKISIGKLDIKIPFSKIAEYIEEIGLEILPITFEDTLKLIELPFHHRDPFDRIIISQGLTKNLTILTVDPQFDAYLVKTLW